MTPLKQEENRHVDDFTASALLEWAKVGPFLHSMQLDGVLLTEVLSKVHIFRAL